MAHPAAKVLEEVAVVTELKDIRSMFCFNVLPRLKVLQVVSADGRSEKRAICDLFDDFITNNTCSALVELVKLLCI